MNYQKGQVSALALWLMGGIGTITLAFGGWGVSQIGAVQGVTVENTNRITVTEVKIDNVERNIEIIREDIKIIRMLLEK